MTTRPKKPCRNKFCRHTTNSKSGFCSECEPKYKVKEKAIRKCYDTRRNPTVKKWQNSKRYITARKIFKSEMIFCRKCSTVKRPVIGNILDHITPHKGDYRLFWDQTNWQLLCKRCHDVKTATEDGGFGNSKRGN